MYIGKAKNLRNRVSSYFVNKANLLDKTKLLVSQIYKIKYVGAGSEIQALLLEANLIKKYLPKYNARLRDGKRYPLIRITIKDKYPKVLIARRYEDDPSGKGSLYFGPYPSSGAVLLVLKIIRRIFPFQSVRNHPKKLCLYNHLGLCPCPELTLPKDYKRNINHIIDFLKGNTKKIINELEMERNQLSSDEEFEKAEDLQKKIDSILFVTNPAYDKFDYITDPNLNSDLRINELMILKKNLLNAGLEVKSLNRIECFDISNISGTIATGSMVVFTNGEKDASQYRKFKIKTVDKIPNDFSMMKEVLQRRFRHPEWQYPDLIIVDGGKSQVSAALNALSVNNREVNNLTINISIIGLAKRDETIVIPLVRHSGQSRISNFTETSLPKDSPALHLIQRIRDEAHRFAIQYHRKLRSKTFLS